MNTHHITSIISPHHSLSLFPPSHPSHSALVSLFVRVWIKDRKINLSEIPEVWTGCLALHVSESLNVRTLLFA
jgi:hypothetical protein